MFLNFGQILRALTKSPIASALDQAHRQAQRYLEDGGAVAARMPTENRSKTAGWLVPTDIDAGLLAKAIEAQLRASAGPLVGPRARIRSPLQRSAGGRLLVRADVLRRLGGGDLERGRRLLERLLPDLRDRQRH